MRAERLTAGDIELRFNIKRGTLWKWVSDGLVRQRGLNGNGHKMYDVAEVKIRLGLAGRFVDDSDEEVS